MTTYINLRNVIKTEREKREYTDKKTKINGIVEIITIYTNDGITTINIFTDNKEV